MKILQVCKKFPFPVRDGESLAVTNLSKALRAMDCEVSLLAMNTRKHFFDLKQLPPNFDHYQSIHAVELDNRIRIKDAFLNLFSRQSYHISRFLSPAFSEKLKQVLQQEEYDVIQLETLYLAPYIPLIRRYSKAVVAMRAHNVEFEIWERIAENTKSPLRKWYLSYLTQKLKRYELEQLNQYDLLIPITERDLRLFRSYGFRGEALVTPIGIEFRDYEPDWSSYHRPLSLSFIGSLDWMPNLEGLRWFLQKCWPLIHRKYPTLGLHVAGRNTPEWLQRLQMPELYIHGEVPSSMEFINEHSLMIVPLLSGSGMRAKILEGMILGKVILSTDLGLEGIGAKHREEALVANSPEVFLQAVDYCYRTGPALQKIGEAGRQMVMEHYDNNRIANRLKLYYESLVENALQPK